MADEEIWTRLIVSVSWSKGTEELFINANEEKRKSVRKDHA